MLAVILLGFAVSGGVWDVSFAQFQDKLTGVCSEVLRGGIITMACLAVLQLMAMRWLTAPWNVLLMLSTALLLWCGMQASLGSNWSMPEVLVPYAAAINLDNMLSDWPLLLPLTGTVWVLSLLCSNSRWLMLLYGSLCYGCWYGAAVLLHMFCGGWETAESLSLLRMLGFMYNGPWITAAIPGAFFLLFFFLLAFFENMVNGRANTARPFPKLKNRATRG